MAHTDVLMLDTIGGAYSPSSLEKSGLGGSEIEMLQVAKGLTGKGYSVVIANGVSEPVREDGIDVVPFGMANYHNPTRALYIQRYSHPHSRLEVNPNVRVVVRANDVYCDAYDVHAQILNSGRATLVANTKWQADQFGMAKDRIVIPPMLEDDIELLTAKEPCLFVYASGPMKGLNTTLSVWRTMKDIYREEMRDCRLAVMSPGWGDFSSVSIDDPVYNIRFIGCPSPAEYRRWIAQAMGLFTVLTMPETFCCAAALAERALTRTHILCEAGLGGIPEALKDSSLVTTDRTKFERDFLEHIDDGWAATRVHLLKDLSPAAMINEWEKALRLDRSAVSIESTFAADPSLRNNQEHLGPFFGDFLSMLRGAIAPGGSEFGVGLSLFSLACSIRAKRIVEIGRFKGFSTLALAAACKLQDIGWQECQAAAQRPDVDYDKLFSKDRALVTSIDPVSDADAEILLEKAGLVPYVERVNMRSQDYIAERQIDLLFIDGSHRQVDLQQDVHRFVPWVRQGGYFILHDYFGWFDDQGRNGSPTARVVAEDLQGFDRLLVDTGMASFVVFQKTRDLDVKPSVIPPRQDGRPTVGLVMIAKGEEVSTVATRAIVTAKKVGVDCVTVVADALDSVADVARGIGADVLVRKSPEIDWKNGFGIIAGARNEALTIAEHRTDYVLVLDADDWLDGSLPSVLDKDSYEVTIHDGGLQYPRVQLFRSNMRFRYAGIIHECLETSGTVGQLSGLKYMRGHSSYGYQDQDVPAVKFSKHAKLAKKWLFDHPDDARMQFYLARSLHDAGRFDEAIVEYEKRIEMLNGWHDERFYSAYQIGLIQLETKRNPTLALLRANELDPKRAEPLLVLARWYRDDARRQFKIAYVMAQAAHELRRPESGLFVTPSVYDYETLAELAICSYWIGKKQDALAYFERLLSRVPASQQRWAADMIGICQRELKG